jgi:hypothetical protein
MMQLARLTNCETTKIDETGGVVSSKRVSLRLVIRNCLVFISVSLVGSCISFTPGPFPITCQLYDQIPLAPLSSNISQTVFETPGQIIAIHGSGGAELTDGKSARAIKVEQSVALPQYVNRAAVFLNGWKLNYLGGDQHVLALGSMITRIRFGVDSTTKQNTLAWDALGLLRDEGGEEGYNWSYDFTVLAWNVASIAADIDQGNENDQFCAPGKILDNYYLSDNFGTTTALSSFFSFIKNIVFTGDRSVAVLPRGFAFMYGTGLTPTTTITTGFTDYHILQIAYNLDHSDIVVDATKKYSIRDGALTNAVPPGASIADSGFVSWNTNTIFKDNDTRRDYLFAEVASAIGGSDIGVIQPPYANLPTDPASEFGIAGLGCGSLSSPPIRTEDVVIQNIPFQYAIPALAGWDLEYQCADQHVKQIGIGIDHWSYQPPSGSAGGTLKYTLFSTLSDDDNWPDFVHNHKVTILGIKPVFGSIK